MKLSAGIKCWVLSKGNKKNVSLDLHDGCQHDHQCYCGSDCEDKIGCNGRICSCKPGHKSYMIRRCIRKSQKPIFLHALA